MISIFYTLYFYMGDISQRDDRGSWTVVREGGAPFGTLFLYGRKSFISYESEIFLNGMMFLIRICRGRTILFWAGRMRADFLPYAEILKLTGAFFYDGIQTKMHFFTGM